MEGGVKELEQALGYDIDLKQGTDFTKSFGQVLGTVSTVAGAASGILNNMTGAEDEETAAEAEARRRAEEEAKAKEQKKKMYIGFAVAGGLALLIGGAVYFKNRG